MSSERPRQPEAATPRAARSAAASRLQTGVRGLLVAVACFGVIAWSARSVWDRYHPALAAIHGLESRKPSDRVRATRELMAAGVNDPSQATPPLLRALEDPAAEVRAGAAEALGVIAGQAVVHGPTGDVARAGTGGLIRALKDADPAVRIAALYALERVAATPGADLAVDFPSVAAALAAMPGDRDDEVRLLSLSMLTRCDPLRSATPPESLGTALRDPSARIRAAAARTLGKYSSPLDPWIDSLLRDLEDEDREVRTACVQTMTQGRAGVSAAGVPALLAALGSRAQLVRYCAARALEPYAQAQGVAEVLLPALVALTRERVVRMEVWDTEYRSHCVRMLGQFAPGTASAGEAVEALTEIVMHDPGRRAWGSGEAAIQALGAFGPAAESAVPALVQALHQGLVGSPSGFPVNGSPAAQALGRIAPGTKSADEALAALIAVLDPRLEGGEVGSGVREVRLATIEALPAFGPAAAPALPRLRAWREDKDPRIGAAAEQAVSEIERAVRARSDGSGGPPKSPAIS